MLGLLRISSKIVLVFTFLSGSFIIFNCNLYLTCDGSIRRRSKYQDGSKALGSGFFGEGIFDTSIIIPSTEVIHKWHKKFSLWRLCCVTPTSL